jgi:hypothetical protein
MADWRLSMGVFDVEGSPRAESVREASWSAVAAATAFRPWFIREMGKSRNKRRYHVLVMVKQTNDDCELR